MKIKKTYLSILLCIISSIFVVLKMSTGNNIYLWVFLIIVCLGLVFDSMEHKVEYLIYFIPWVYALKFQFSQFSLYVLMSALYVILCVLYLLWTRCKIRNGLFLSFGAFVIYVIAIPLLNHNVTTKTLGFLLNYASIFFALMLVSDNKLFGRYAHIYALGLISSGLVGLMGFVNPDINSYIVNMTNIDTVVAGGYIYHRFVGLDLDPNYFSLQILIAISCLLVKLYYDRRDLKLSLVVLTVLAGLGMISLSKMYIIILCFLVVMAIIVFFKNDIRIACKFLTYIIACGGVAIYYTYDYFRDAFLERFIGPGATMSDITTGRTDIWKDFFNVIFSNTKLLILGKGYGSDYLNAFTAHNMYFTALYYMGLAGMIIALILFWNLYKNLKLDFALGNKIKFLDVNTIPLWVLLVANLSLDSIVMDYFPIHLFLVIFAMCYRAAPLSV